MGSIGWLNIFESKFYELSAGLLESKFRKNIAEIYQ